MRFVRWRTGFERPARTVSYVCSSDRYTEEEAKPLVSNVDSRVLISVVGCPAIRAYPLANLQVL